MSTGTEDDFCRVCRSEGSEADPLFYPCKCSGSIRYVHQDCLMEWLAHSQKKHCELCKTPFQFTNFYDPDMPKRLPFRQLVRKMLVDVRSGILLFLRWLLVALVWLIWLPYCTRHIWRSTIRIGDHMTSNGLTHLHELANMTGDSYTDATTVATSLSSNQTEPVLHTFLPFSLQQFTPSEAVNKIVTEVFEGQVITSVVVAVFVVVFLIREWIVQNNANLLDEAPEFIARGTMAPNEARRRQLRIAGPLGEEENREQIQATGRAVVDDAITYFEAQRANRNTGRNPLHVNADMTEPRTLIPRQPPVESSDWDNLTAQALHNARRGRDVHASRDSAFRSFQSALDSGSEPSSESEELGSPGSHVLSGDLNPLDDSAMTAAELRALRRQAILRAASQRISQAQDRSEAVQMIDDLPGTTFNSSDAIPPTRDTAQLDVQLANDEGLPTVGHARIQFARQRSTERKVWEEAEELGGEDYPNSPMPAPISSPDAADELLLPPPSLEASGRPQSPSIDLGDSHVLREGEIAATSHNPEAPEVQSDPTTGPAPERSSFLQSVPSLTPAQLESLLDQVRDATTPSERTHVANAAIQVCIDMAQLIRPDQPLDRASPLYRETIRQVGTIAMVANEYGIEHALDVERAFRIAESRPIVRHAHNLNDVAIINNEVELNQDDVRGLQAAVVDGNAEANAVRDEMDDDIDGLLQLIGVRGAVVTLLQNSMLIVIMMTSFIVFGICLPDICGRFMISVAKDPYTYLVRIPSQVILVVLHESTRIVRLTIRGAGILTSPILAHSRATKYFLLGSQKILGAGRVAFESPGYSFDVNLHWDELAYTAHQALIDSAAFVARSGAAKTLTEIGATVPQRPLAVVCGYIGLTSAGAMYLKANRRLTSGEQGKQIELALRSFLRQTGFVMKFITILSIELVVFPFYCGLLLDAVFLPLFKQASLLDRLSFLAQYPFTSIFLHWLIGTVYMFNFALFVSMCREIVRPGVLYFIRDPNDPGFNPIKDILERPVRSQMRKIGVSVMIYGTLIIGAFGSVVWGVAYYMQGVLPLNWNTTEPLFEVPFDLLLFQVLLPLTYRYMKPHKKIKGVWTQWFITSSRLLRLSSFMLGERDESQEGHINGRTSIISQIWFKSPDITDEGFVKDGSFRRVPTTDSLPMRKGKDMIMAVTEDNVLIEHCDDDDTKDDPNYSVVYAPPNFKLRIYLFIFSLWAFAAVFCISCTVLPLILGRKIFRAISPNTHMHDIFAYLYGAYTLGLAVWLLLMLSELHKPVLWIERLRTRLQGPDEARHCMHEVTKFTLKWLYLISTLSILTPTLLGLCLETYVIIPIGIWLHPGYTPTIHLIHDWIVGLIYVKIVGRTAMMMPMSTLGQALNNTVHNDWRNGWRNPDLRIATKKIILPVAGALIAALMLPLSIGALARGTVYRGAPKEVTTLIYRMSYPAALISCVVILVVKGTHVLIARWRTRIRDTLYLKGRRLHNFGESQPPSSISVLQAPMTDAEEEDVVGTILEEIVQEIENDEN